MNNQQALGFFTEKLLYIILAVRLRNLRSAQGRYISKIHRKVFEILFLNGFCQKFETLNFFYVPHFVLLKRFYNVLPRIFFENVLFIVFVSAKSLHVFVSGKI